MRSTKITITKQEYAVMTNVQFLYTKASVIEKVKGLLSELRDEIDKDLVNTVHIDDLFRLHGKISKGENYLGLPFLILDYPGIFDKENIFVMRSMFWWGNYFLFTLHLQGIYWQEMKKTLIANLSELKPEGAYISTDADPWRHELSTDNFTPLSDLKNIPEKNDFFKIAFKLELEQWQQVPAAGKKYFELFMKLSGADNMS